MSIVIRAKKFTRKHLGKIPIKISRIIGPFFWKRDIVYLTGYGGSIDRIGELAHQFDMFIKMGYLGMGPFCRATILVNREIANPALLKYWELYFNINYNPSVLTLFLASFIQYNTAFVKMPNSKELMHKNLAYTIVTKQWEENNRLPLIQISEMDYKMGWNKLRRLGLKEESWFVCLHVREPGFFRDWNIEIESYRDADISTYTNAIETITNAGGYVIRMGDNTMTQLPEMYHVIDYANSSDKSDWMDIFLCSQCRFFLGTTSGLFVVSTIFNIPCALTNVTPIVENPWSSHSLFIPKLCTNEEGTLIFKKLFESHLIRNYDGRKFKKFGLTMVDNTPNQINDLTIEMMQKLNSPKTYTNEDEKLQLKIKSFYPSLNSRMGKEFLKEHKELI